MDAGSRAPLLSHVSESFDGLSSVRAFDATRRFTLACEARLDANLRAASAAAIANCWLGLRLEVLGGLVAAAAALLAFTRARSAIHPNIGASALGLTLALQVTHHLLVTCWSPAGRLLVTC